jgi:hypothetical protein
VKAQPALIAMMLGILGLGAQDPERLVNLKPTNSVELSLGSSLDLVGVPKCDGAGNVYARLVSHASGDYFLAPIRAVRQDGRLAGTFSLTEAWPDAVGRGVFVDAAGDVYHAAIAPGGAYVVEFARDGSVKTKTKLQTRGFLDPWHLVVYQSGRFLVSGTEGKSQRTPYTAIFEGDGKLVKQIYEPEDEDARTKADSGDAEFTQNAETGNRFVDLGDISLGSDGNAYLLHGTSPALVYVISATGDVIRKMRITADSSGLPFRSIQSRAGRLAVGLARFGRIEVRVTDLEGTLVDSYAVDTEKSDVPRLACYGASGFTIITVATEGSVHLVLAKP